MGEKERNTMSNKIKPKNPFAKEVKDVTLSIRLSQEAVETLKLLADEAEITYNRYIAKLVEIHLEELAQAGELPTPKSEKKKNGRST